MSLQNLQTLQIWRGKFSSTWKILIVFCGQYDRWQDESATVKLLFWNHDSHCWCYHPSYGLGRGHFVFLLHVVATYFRFFLLYFCVLSWHEGKWPICHWHLWGQIDAHITVKFFIFYMHLHCLLLHAQHCCHHLLGKVANKIQEILHSNEYYHEGGIKL